MSFWNHEEWIDAYFADPYWNGTGEAKKQTGPKPGYWNPEFWANEYWNNQYWFDTQTHELDYLIQRPTKVGGDDAPRYYKHKHRGWDKKAWQRRKKLDDDLLQTIESTLRPKKKKKHVPDYQTLLKELQRADDEESAMLLL